MKDIAKTALVLTLIAVIAGILLGGVNQLTYQSPAEKLANNLNKAYENEGGWEEVSYAELNIKSADAFTSLTGAYKAKDSEKTVYIYSTTSKGYKTGLNLMIVVEDNKIINIMKTASGETIAKPLSQENFGKYYGVDLTAEGFNGFRTNKQAAADGKTEVEAIASATKSSNAICNSVDLVVAYHKAIVGGAK